MLEKWQYKDLLGHVSAKRVKTAPSIGYRGFNIPLFLFSSTYLACALRNYDRRCAISLLKIMLKWKANFLNIKHGSCILTKETRQFGLSACLHSRLISLCEGHFPEEHSEDTVHPKSVDVLHNTH